MLIRMENMLRRRVKIGEYQPKVSHLCSR